MSSALDTVRATLQAYIDACNAGDADAYAATLAPDCVTCPPGVEPLEGREAAASWAEDNFFSLFDITFDAAFDRMIETDGEIMAPGSFQLHLTPKEGGDEIDLTGTFFNIFREVSPGEWKYSWLLWNFRQPSA